MAATTPLVGIVMGSNSDWETMERCAKQLEALGVPYEARIISAHRTPAVAHEYAWTAAERGLKVIIAAAGLAAHLAGAMAAGTPLPVIGVPMDAGALNGIDALLSTVQMPPGVPVATVGIGKPGATNAAILALQILATAGGAYADAVARFRAEQTDKIIDTNTAFQAGRG
ncbi:MAG: 5-(carboxyamino)imidazole ribonucleotide mutase [Planctomycetota bacterium]